MSKEKPFIHHCKLKTGDVISSNGPIHFWHTGDVNTSNEDTLFMINFVDENDVRFNFKDCVLFWTSKY